VGSGRGHRALLPCRDVPIEGKDERTRTGRPAGHRSWAA
jgi:hypothetical protein